MVWPSRYSSRAAAQLTRAAGRAAVLVRRLRERQAISDDQHPSSRIARLASYGLLGALVGVLVIVAAATVPGLFGYHTYDVRGGSMKPSIQNGSVVVTRATSPPDLEVGDVIARPSREDSAPVLHRVVEITTMDGERYFVTQGDANRTADATPVSLRGPGDKVVYSVPYAGYVVRYAGGGAGRLLLIVVPLTLLALLLLRERWRGLPAPAAAGGVPAPGPALRAPGTELAPLPAPPASHNAILDVGAGETERLPAAGAADEAAPSDATPEPASPSQPPRIEPEPQRLPDGREDETEDASADLEPASTTQPPASGPEPKLLPEPSEPPAEPAVEAAPTDATPEPTSAGQPPHREAEPEPLPEPQEPPPSEPEPQGPPEAREDETEDAGADLEPASTTQPPGSGPEPELLPEPSEPPTEHAVEAAPAAATPASASQPQRKEPEPHALSEPDDETEEAGAEPDSSHDPLPPLKVTRRRREVPDLRAPDLPNYLADRIDRRRRAGPPSRTEEEGG